MALVGHRALPQHRAVRFWRCDGDSDALFWRAAIRRWSFWGREVFGLGARDGMTYGKRLLGRNGTDAQGQRPAAFSRPFLLDWSQHGATQRSSTAPLHGALSSGLAALRRVIANNNYNKSRVGIRVESAGSHRCHYHGINPRNTPFKLGLGRRGARAGEGDMAMKH